MISSVPTVIGQRADLVTKAVLLARPNGTPIEAARSESVARQIEHDFLRV